ncbi:MAG TPA: hypothetical protein VNU46_09480 [Gemmatimonadaceae bacterium]|jgi:hypothetical protein|nr:hypothetical protein [Gemmatimonadaceae bacterium]
MKRSLTTAFAVALIPTLATAQQWNAPRTRSLVERATIRREAQLADTGLRNYKAEARGYLTFLAQLGKGFPDPPKVIRTDQIASDLYWRAPNFSKQMIKGRRDTLLLPTDIAYHRDHLGIIQNNFPNIIRLGDGDEVQDVPHPLSPVGLREYDYALHDSLQILLGPKALDVYEVLVRPKNDHAPRAVGSVYIDRESGEVVRMSLSFTRAALKDKDLEDVSIILENGLIDGRFWLPRRQEIEIRRTGTWLDYPARGIIRGRWEISNYDVNTNFPVDFNGPEIMAAPGSTVSKTGMVTNPTFHFPGGILDSLPPDVSAVTDADVQKAQDDARALVGERVLERSQTLALSGQRVSDFVHVNRVQGLAVGGGLVQPLGSGLAVGAHAMYGGSDHAWTTQGLLSYHGVSGAGVDVTGYHTLQDVSEVPERSGVINTFAAQEFGSDYTDLYRARGVALAATTSTLAAFHITAEIADERQDAAIVHAEPANGHYMPTIPALPWRETRMTLGLVMPTQAIVGGFEASLSAKVSGIRGRLIDSTTPDVPQSQDFFRASLVADLEHQIGDQRLVFQTVAAGLSNGPELPPQHLVYLGGPVSAPGYDFHSLVGRVGVSQRAEWRFKVPFIRIPLATWGSAPANLTLAPYVNGAWIDSVGWKPSVGVGALTVFDLLRFDVARGLQGGRWTFNVDVSHLFWSVL